MADFRPKTWAQVMDDRDQMNEASAAEAQRLATMPADAYTVAWVQREIAKCLREQTGMLRIITRQASDQAAADGRIRELTAQNTKLRSDLSELQAAFAELRHKQTQTEARMDKMAQWAARQQQPQNPQ